MKRMKRDVFFWTPRVLSILFAGFISIFALDIFSENFTFWMTVLALLIHLIPTYIVIIIIFIAWKWERIGAILFCGLSVFYIVWTWGKFVFLAYLFISGPLVIISILFLLDWTVNKKRLKENL
ncbi:hypothetical protein J7L48_00115 [bacterium]|nr:hypothetical protein [bacterium]